MARKVIWSDEAIVDLGAVVRYIAADNSSAAEALARTIFERTRMLAEFPHAGRQVRKNMMRKFERSSSSPTGLSMKHVKLPPWTFSGFGTPPAENQ